VFAILSHPVKNSDDSNHSNSHSNSNSDKDDSKTDSSHAHAHTNANANAHEYNSYIAASYVRWLEDGGARSIPIPFDASRELVEELLAQVDGVLFPGGAASVPSPAAISVWRVLKGASASAFASARTTNRNIAKDNGYTHNTKHNKNKNKNTNNNNNSNNNNNIDPIPLWGTCAGFEFIVRLAACDDVDVDVDVDSYDYAYQYSHSDSDTDTDSNSNSHETSARTDKNSNNSNTNFHRRHRHRHYNNREDCIRLGYDPTILQNGFDATNVSWPLYDVRSPTATNKPTTNKNENKNKNTKNTGIFGPDWVRTVVTTRNVTLHNHEMGLLPEAFARAPPGLSERFAVTSVGYDRAGRPFVASIEPTRHDPHRNRRRHDEFDDGFDDGFDDEYDEFDFDFVYAVQYHPEKNAHEYGLYPGTNIPYEAIDHSPEGIAVGHYQAMYLVEKARELLRVRNKDKHKDSSHNLSSSSSSSSSSDPNAPKYTKPVRFPLVLTYPRVLATEFQEKYLIPPASHWEKEKEDVAAATATSTATSTLGSSVLSSLSSSTARGGNGVAEREAEIATVADAYDDDDDEDDDDNANARSTSGTIPGDTAAVASTIAADRSLLRTKYR